MPWVAITPNMRVGNANTWTPSCLHSPHQLPRQLNMPADSTIALRALPLCTQIINFLRVSAVFGRQARFDDSDLEFKKGFIRAYWRRFPLHPPPCKHEIAPEGTMMNNQPSGRTTASVILRQYATSVVSQRSVTHDATQILPVGFVECHIQNARNDGVAG